MANTISFIIRAIDATKAGVNSAKTQLNGLAKALGGGGIAGMLGRGAIAGALVLSARAVARWAEDIRASAKGAFSDFEMSGAIAISNLSKKFSLFGQSVKATIVGIAGYWADKFGLGGAATTDEDVATVKAQEAENALARERVEMMRAERGGEQAVLDLLNERLATAQELYDTTERNAKQLEKVEQITSDIHKREKAIADEKAKQADAEAKAVRDREEKAGEERLELAQKREARYTELALMSLSERAAEGKKMRKEKNDKRKMNQLADAAEASMGRGISFDKLGRQKQLAFLARQEKQASANYDSMPGNIKGLADTAALIASALGVNAQGGK